jgi:hypothetical protein
MGFEVRAASILLIGCPHRKPLQLETIEERERERERKKKEGCELMQRRILEAILD